MPDSLEPNNWSPNIPYPRWKMGKFSTNNLQKQVNRCHSSTRAYYSFELMKSFEKESIKRNINSGCDYKKGIEME